MVYADYENDENEDEPEEVSDNQDDLGEDFSDDDQDSKDQPDSPIREQDQGSEINSPQLKLEYFPVDNESGESEDMNFDDDRKS